MDNTNIRILITGGTIDDLDYEREEDAPTRISLDYKVEILMQKDSRVITDKDRKLILGRCRDSEENKIIVTHGTFTMPQTAEYLDKANFNKTIVLFGSAIPANNDKSDALFNLGAAFTAVQLLSNGVYIVMNGKVFSWDNVQKNLSSGFFEEKVF